MNAMCLRNYNCTIGSIVNKYRHKLFVMTTKHNIARNRHGTQVLLKLHVNFILLAHKAYTHTHTYTQCTLGIKCRVYQQQEISRKWRKEEKKNNNNNYIYTHNWRKSERTKLPSSLYPNVVDVRVSFVWAILFAILVRLN